MLFRYVPWSIFTEARAVDRYDQQMMDEKEDDVMIEKEDDDLNSSSKIRGGKVITTLRGIRRTVSLLFNQCRGIASHLTRK